MKFEKIFKKNNLNMPRILMYHGVEMHYVSNKWDVRKDQFYQHIEFLHQNSWNFCFLDELEDKIKSKISKLVVITFDDGYQNNYTNAFEILQKFNAKATIYLCKNIDNSTLLNKDQINIMLNSGLVKFGCHTLNHSNLKKLSQNRKTRSLIQDELLKSKNHILDITGQEPTSFAYPYGKHNFYIRRQVKKAGFKFALSTKNKICNVLSFILKKLSLPRLGVTSNATLDNFKKLIQYK